MFRLHINSLPTVSTRGSRVSGVVRGFLDAHASSKTPILMCGFLQKTKTTVRNEFLHIARLAFRVFKCSKLVPELRARYLCGVHSKTYKRHYGATTSK